MASPGELVRTFAEFLDIPVSTIVVHDRNLVTAGLRSKSGRGTSAARMTARDAAHLLVAVLGSSHVKDSVETVRGYGEARFFKEMSTGYDASNVEALQNLPSDHSFVDAVEALIGAAADGSLQQAMYNDIDEFKGEKIGFAPIIEITVRTPGLLGDISIRGRMVNCDARYGLPSPYDHHRTPPAEEVTAWKRKLREYHVDSDLTQYRKVTARTIIALGQLIGN
jgi:hypothetical protein